MTSANSDDDSSTESLLVSPTKSIDPSYTWGGNETAAIQNDHNFKNHSNGGDDPTDAADNNRTMDVTFQDSIDMPHREEPYQNGDSLVFEADAADAATPAKQRFSYAAAMEQLDDSWLAPTPKRPGNFGGDDSLDLTMEEVELGKCLEEQFEESPVSDELPEDHILEEMPRDEIVAMAERGDIEVDTALSSPTNVNIEAYTALASETKHSLESTTQPALLNSQNIDSSTEEADTTSAIFRHGPIHHTDQQQQITSSTSSNMMTLQLGHPVNESYDSVEQRKLHLEQESKCISSFLVDRDRVENVIMMNRVGYKEAVVGGADDGVGGEERNYSVSDTLKEEEQSGEENDGAINETALSLEHDEGDEESDYAVNETGSFSVEDDEDERCFKNSVLDTLEEHGLDEAKFTLTQTADCSADSDGFLKKIENAESEEQDLVLPRCEEAEVNGNDDVMNGELGHPGKEVGQDEAVDESHLTDHSEESLAVKNDTLTAELNAEYEDNKEEGIEMDMNVSTSGSNLTRPATPTENIANDNGEDEEENDNDTFSPSVSPAEANNLHGAASSVGGSSEISGGSNLKGEDIIENKSNLASSRGDSLAFSTSIGTEDTLGLSHQALNTSQSSEESDDIEEKIASTAPEGNSSDEYLEYSTTNQPSSEVEMCANLSFDSTNSLSASLDVSLSNIDREALFATSFTQQLSPIRQNSSSPHDLSHRHDDDLKGDEIQLPAALDTSPVAGSLSPQNCKSIADADGKDKSSCDDVENDDDDFAVAAGGPLERSPVTAENAEVNKGSIFAVLSQVNTGTSSNDVVVQAELPMNEQAFSSEKDELLLNPSGYCSPKENDVTECASVGIESQKSNVETTDRHVNSQSPIDEELDERNKSLEDLSSYQQSFNSTSSAFLERLRGAAEKRKREVTKARFSMERKEQILYEKKEDREVLPTLSEVTEENTNEENKTTTFSETKAKPFGASESTLQLQSGYSQPRSTSTRGSKRKSPDALGTNKYNKPYETNAAVSAKLPKRLLSGTDASKAKEMARRKLLQEEEERIRRESVFRARPLPASTLSRACLGEQRTRTSNNSKAARAGKENSAFKPSSTARAEKRAAWNAEKKARDEDRRQEQIRKRNALVNEANEEIEKLKRFLR